MINLAKNVLIYTVCAIVIFVTVIYYMVPTVWFQIILNSVFIGCIFSIAIAYAKFIWKTVTGFKSYDRARHYFLGVVMQWIGVTFLIGNSAFIYTVYEERSSLIPTTILGPLARLFIIAAAILQITAPDFKQNFLETERDRRLLWFSIVCGVIVGIIAAYLQGGF